MQCIPTFAVMPPTDAELVAARQRLVEYLEEHDPNFDDTRASGILSYLCSIPRRHDNGAILYVHVFQRDRLRAKEEFFSVAASPYWWPVGCRSLPPQQRTRGRAALRLVS